MSRLSLLAPLVFLAACQATSAPSQPFPSPPAESTVKGMQTAVFAGGCFWGIEAIFDRIKGVSHAVSGYSGGTKNNPTYEEVSSGTTGHAEAVEVTYDPSVVSYGTLMKVFFSVGCDPTELNYQGPDHGTQYRSALFFKTPEQEATARAYLKTLSDAKIWKDPIVTEVTAFTAFWPAEDYHQQFLDKNPNWPYIVRFDMPKIAALNKQYPDLISYPRMMWHGVPIRSQEETLSYPITKTDAEWKKQLVGLAYEVLRHEGTERPFTGPLNDEHRKGTFYSAATGQPLFRSEDKFDSGTGWPSFSRPIAQTAVVLRLDTTLGMERVEVEDSSSGSHLGHVFDDGPAPTGLRYCMNSASLLFVADGEDPPPLVKNYRP